MRAPHVPGADVTWTWSRYLSWPVSKRRIAKPKPLLPEAPQGLEMCSSGAPRRSLRVVWVGIHGSFHRCVTGLPQACHENVPEGTSLLSKPLEVPSQGSDPDAPGPAAPSLPTEPDPRGARPGCSCAASSRGSSRSPVSQQDADLAPGRSHVHISAGKDLSRLRNSIVLL